MTEGRKRAHAWGVRRCIWLAVLISVLPAIWRYGTGCRQPPSVATDWRSQVIERLELRRRDSWNAREPKRVPAALDMPTRVTIHHSGGKKFTRFEPDDVARSIRAIQNDHQKNRGWADIAYHYVIDPAGGVWEARDSHLVGAHAGSSKLNEDNLGVLLLGNFEIQEPTNEQIETLADFLRLIRELCSIPGSEIYTHNEIRTGAGLAATACPGKHLTPLLQGMRD